MKRIRSIALFALVLALILAACAAPAQADMFAHPDLHGILNDPSTPKMQGLPEQLKQTVGEEKAEEILDTIPAQLYPVEVAPESSGAASIVPAITIEISENGEFRGYEAHVTLPAHPLPYTLESTIQLWLDGRSVYDASNSGEGTPGPLQYTIGAIGARIDGSPDQNATFRFYAKGTDASGNTLFEYELIEDFVVSHTPGATL